MNSSRNACLVLIILGVLVQGAASTFAVMRHGGIDAFAFRSLDAREYFLLADNLRSTGTFSAREAPPLEPDTWRTPGYPVLLWVGMQLVGPSPAGLVALQQLLSIVNVLLFFKIARSIMSPRRALIAASLFLLAPYRLYYSLWLLATTAFTTVLLLAWLSWRSDRIGGSATRAVVTGLLLAASVLIRPVALLIPPVLIVAAGFRRTALAAPGAVFRGPAWRQALLMLVACSVVLGGWSLRNRVTAGHWGLSSQSGVVAAYFKAAEVELWRQGRSADRYVETSLDASNVDKPHRVWDEIDRRLHERLNDLPQHVRDTLTWRNLAQGNRGGYDPFIVSATLAAIARDMLLEAPLATIAFCLKRSAMLLTFPAHLALESEASAMQGARRAAIGALYAALLVAALARLCRGRLAAGELLFPVASVLCLLAATTPQLDPRFRAPMVPLLLFIAFLPVPVRGTTTEKECAEAPNIGPDAPPADAMRTEHA